MIEHRTVRRNAFIGYLGCDEFSMLKPITEWIKADDKPFLLTVLCSITHDPYEAPNWFAEPAKEPLDRYLQAITYTDQFIAALDVELKKLNLAENTIFCVIGDHGEAFGEHNLYGHERIAFEEALRIPFCLRTGLLTEPNTKITKPVSSIDLTPTLLTMLGLGINDADFDGINALGNIPDDRKVYFSGWVQQGPAGFIEKNKKFIYYPTTEIVSVYDLTEDPCELNAIGTSPQYTEKISKNITNWQKSTIFQIDQRETGKKNLFNSWLCRWNNRVSSAKHLPQNDRKHQDNTKLTSND